VFSYRSASVDFKGVEREACWREKEGEAEVKNEGFTAEEGEGGGEGGEVCAGARDRRL
jgi:hypothetical protein